MNRRTLTVAAGVVLLGISLIASALPPPSRIVSKKLPPKAAPPARPVPPPPPPVGAVWLTSMGEAMAIARRERKVILVNFTGSDWCGWCIRLHKEVFSQKPFLDYAARHLVLLTVDFPRSKWQTPEQKRENEDLARRYGIRGYPTILLLDPDGRVIGQTGYRKGGPVSYVNHLRTLLRR
jgi:protein disulfide-isomerase